MTRNVLIVIVFMLLLHFALSYLSGRGNLHLYNR